MLVKTESYEIFTNTRLCEVVRRAGIVKNIFVTYFIYKLHVFQETLKYINIFKWSLFLIYHEMHWNRSHVSCQTLSMKFLFSVNESLHLSHDYDMTRKRSNKVLHNETYVHNNINSNRSPTMRLFLNTNAIATTYCGYFNI